VKEAIKTSLWYKQPLHVQHLYGRIKSELTDTHLGVLLKGSRIIIPQKLQQKIIDLAHEGHLGIVRTKEMLRRKVWFPNMSSLIESSIKSCYACQVATIEKRRSPLSMSKLPEEPWSELSMDFYTLSSGEELLVIIDDHSRFPIVQTIKSTSFKYVKSKLDDILSTFGIPDVIRTDNGPPFNGKEFADFASSLGFKHQKITPLWREANGEAERFMRTIGKVVRTTKAEGKVLQEQLTSFLRNYRTSKHPSTGSSPSSLLFGRENRNKIPEVAEIDKIAKEKMKAYADSRRHTKEINLENGDQVLMKKTGLLLKKSDPQYEPDPLTVISIKGSMITATNKSKTVTRNSSFFRRFYPRKQQAPPPQLPPKPTSKKVTFVLDHKVEAEETDDQQNIPVAEGGEETMGADQQEAAAMQPDLPVEDEFHGFEPQRVPRARPTPNRADYEEDDHQADPMQPQPAKEKRKRAPPKHLESYEVTLPGKKSGEKKS